ncbi:hypothetical protein GC56T2_2973 [Geobacillus sp. C56-T2]|nr:hypothetical protein GC56T2_2973 [Geobacillus sp. C56-T2]
MADVKHPLEGAAKESEGALMTEHFEQWGE